MAAFDRSMLVHVRDNIFKIPYRRLNGKASNRYFMQTRCFICDGEAFPYLANYSRSGQAVCSRRCLTTSITGSRNTNWVGGRKFKRGSDGGHVLIYAPNHPNAKKSNVPEHRLVLEENIGRYLLQEEIVHHIDMVPDSNGIDNLVLCANSAEHHSIHGTLNKSVAALLDSGILRFDRISKRYYVDSEIAEFCRRKTRGLL